LECGGFADPDICRVEITQKNPIHTPADHARKMQLQENTVVRWVRFVNSLLALQGPA